MALAHKIGEDKCTIFAQDISQRSNKMLKLNLILNSLVSSLDHAIQGDTLIAPYHKSDNGQELRTFDYVVSNPPFKMDFQIQEAYAMPFLKSTGKGQLENITTYCRQRKYLQKKRVWQFIHCSFSTFLIH